MLSGGSEADTFVFDSASFGNDQITDFSLAGGDVVSFKTSLFANFSAVQAASTQVGADTVIQFDTGNTVVLKNISLASLTAGDFIFVA